MQDRTKFNDDVTVGTQPTEDQLAELARAGFRTVVNLRTVGERDQPLAPEAEGKAVRALGMAYLHLPVSTKGLKAEQVDEFRRQFADLAKPAFVHCYVGIRAGAFMMMSVAVGQGMSGDQALRQAEQMGLRCDQPELKEFVKGYVDRHRK
jgi:uncharacterized protein (TIGR01244 family)